MKKEYKYICSTLEVLLWESQLKPKPEEHLITFAPKKGDIALVNGVEYLFNGKDWGVIDND